MRSLLRDDEDLQAQNMPDIDQMLSNEAENEANTISDLIIDNQHQLEPIQKRKAGRKVKYEDKRYKSTESMKLSPSVKLKMDILKSVNFDNQTFTNIINILVDQYIDRDLRAEEREYFKEKYVKEMKDLAAEMKIPLNKQGKINENN